MATTDLEERVRARLKQLRFERGVTVAALADKAGVAKSTISRLETGRRGITLSHVARLAAALQVSTDDLIGAPPAQAPSIRDGKTWHPVGPGKAAGAHLYQVAVPADLTEPHLHSHEGRQWLYVLDGHIRVVLERSDTILAPGESTQFDTWEPHWVGAARGPAEALVIFRPQNEG